MKDFTDAKKAKILHRHWEDSNFHLLCSKAISTLTTSPKFWAYSIQMLEKNIKRYWKENFENYEERKYSTEKELYDKNTYKLLHFLLYEHLCKQTQLCERYSPKWFLLWFTFKIWRLELVSRRITIDALRNLCSMIKSVTAVKILPLSFE